MPRFIFSDTREELIQKRNAWKMKYDARKQLYDDQERNYDKARWAWEDRFKDLVTKQFRSYIDKLPGLRINTDRGWGDVEIRFNYEDHGRDDRARKSLLWSYYVKLNEKGEITKESNSLWKLNWTLPLVMKKIAKEIYRLLIKGTVILPKI